MGAALHPPPQYNETSAMLCNNYMQDEKKSANATMCKNMC